MSNPVAPTNMISSSTIQTDPWIVSNNYNIELFGDCMSLSRIELEY